MRTKFYWLAALALLLVLSAVPCLAQSSVTITGTVNDTTGRAYANGSGSAVLTPSIAWTIQGKPVLQTVWTFGLSSTGTFSVQIPAVTAYDQQNQNPSYTFRFCSTNDPNPPYSTVQSCFSVTAVEPTTSEDITSSIVASTVILPTIPCSNLDIGCNGGGGSGSVTPGAQYLLPFYPTFGTAAIVSPSNLFTDVTKNNLTVPGALTANGNGDAGNVALKTLATNNIRYVASSGSDSNDGLSWGTAKATVMAGYDALPAAGGTVNICGNTATSLVYATNGGLYGIWIMGPADPNYASPPAGWRQAKTVSFVGACGNYGDQQGTKPTVFVSGPSSYALPAIWLSSMQGSQANLHFENLEFKYYSTAVKIGVDSNGAQTATSGVYGASFENIDTKACNPTCGSGAGPGWLIGGGDTFDLYLDHIVAQGNPQATAGSDNQAAILMKPTGSGSGIAAGAIITNSLVQGGGLKYYEGNAGSELIVSNLYSEGINGGSGANVATVWLNSCLISICSVDNAFTADAFGSPVYDFRTDSGPYDEGSITLSNVQNIYPSQIGQQGSIVANNMGTRAVANPLTFGANGFANGRAYSFFGNTQRAFVPSMIRYANLADTSMASVPTPSGGTVTTGIADMIGGTGAIHVQTTNMFITPVQMYSGSLSIAVGDYFVAGLYERITTNTNPYAAGAGGSGVMVNVGGSGNTASCSQLVEPAYTTNQWIWTWEICEVTAASTSPATVTVTEDIGGGLANVARDLFAPILVHVPAADMSADEAYDYANDLVPYKTTCVVGTLCNIAGPAFSGGTVTNVSSGNAAPLFTVSVSNGTTTPSFAFTISNASGNSVFGNCTGSTAAPSYCSLTEPMLPAPTVFTDQSATFGAHNYDFSGVTLLKQRVGAGLTTSANGDIGYDSSALMWHGWMNAADSIFAMFPASSSIANGDCTNWNKVGGVITLGDAGAACGSGGGGGSAFNALTSGTNTTMAAVVGTGASITRSGTGHIDADKILGLAPAASATTDTTNASNIITGTLPAAQLPNPSASTLGGIESLAPLTHNYLTGISTSGVPSQSQPSAADLSDAPTAGNYLRGNGTAFVSGPIQAADVPTLNQNTNGTAGNLSGTPALPNGTTATTQSPLDNSTKLATTAYADAGAAASNPMTTIGDRIGGGASGVRTRVAAGLTGQIDTAVNGSTGGFSSPGVAGRTVSGTTDTILCDNGTTLRDRGTVILYTSASAIAAALPQAGSTGCSSNFIYSPFVLGAGQLTTTPATSTINGQSSLVQIQNSWCSISSPDNSNYLGRCATYIRAGAGLTPTFNADGSTTFALAAALPNGTAATTQSQGNNSTDVATTAYVDSKARIWQECAGRGLGDGLNAIPAGTYLQTTCLNDTGSTITITGIKCFSDTGTPTLNVTNSSGTALLTGAVTCSSSYASGTQSATTTLANGDYAKFTFVAGGTTKQTDWQISGTY